MSDPRDAAPLARNPLVHRDRRLSASTSEFVRSFSCEDVGVLIVCRGPIRSWNGAVRRESDRSGPRL